MKAIKATCLFAFIFLTSTAFISTAQTAGDLEPVQAHFSSQLQPKTSFKWTVQRFYQAADWLNPDSSYSPQSGDQWTMTVIGDLSEISLAITDLFFFGTVFNPDGLPLFSDYFAFDIAGYGFEETFGSETDNERNWLVLTKLFLTPEVVIHDLLLIPINVTYLAGGAFAIIWFGRYQFWEKKRSQWKTAGSNSRDNINAVLLGSRETPPRGPVLLLMSRSRTLSRSGESRPI